MSDRITLRYFYQFDPTLRAITVPFRGTCCMSDFINVLSKRIRVPILQLSMFALNPNTGNCDTISLYDDASAYLPNLDYPEDICRRGRYIFVTSSNIEISDADPDETDEPKELNLQDTTSNKDLKRQNSSQASLPHLTKFQKMKLWLLKKLSLLCRPRSKKTLILATKTSCRLCKKHLEKIKKSLREEAS